MAVLLSGLVTITLSIAYTHHTAAEWAKNGVTADKTTSFTTAKQVAAASFVTA